MQKRKNRAAISKSGLEHLKIVPLLRSQKGTGTNSNDVSGRLGGTGLAASYASAQTPIAVPIKIALVYRLFTHLV